MGLPARIAFVRTGRELGGTAWLGRVGPPRALPAASGTHVLAAEPMLLDRIWHPRAGVHDLLGGRASCLSGGLPAHLLPGCRAAGVPWGQAVSWLSVRWRAPGAGGGCCPELLPTRAACSSPPPRGRCQASVPGALAWALLRVMLGVTSTVVLEPTWAVFHLSGDNALPGCALCVTEGVISAAWL